MKSRQSLKNSARFALSCSLFAFALLFAGCSSPHVATFDRTNIEQAVHDIGKKDYSLDLQAKLVGNTLWVYLPLDTLLEESTGKKQNNPPQKPRLFVIKENTIEIADRIVRVSYAIEPPPDDQVSPGMQYNKGASEKVNRLWRMMRRLVFSMDHSKSGVRFLCIVAGDIKEGYYINDIVYIDDLKKVSYEYISLDEFQHRIVQDAHKADNLVGDKEGAHILYRDISWEEFITGQIHDRIQMKFGKPEVEKKADVDKEILKTVEITLSLYNYYDFDSLELVDPRTQRKIILSPAALRNHTSAAHP